MLFLPLTKPTTLKFQLTEYTLVHRDATCDRKRWEEKKQMIIWILLSFDVTQRKIVDIVFSNFN